MPGVATLGGIIAYISPESGRQFVVIAAGGALGVETQMSDHIMAYALPKSDNWSFPDNG